MSNLVVVGGVDSRLLNKYQVAPYVKVWAPAVDVRVPDGREGSGNAKRSYVDVSGASLGM